MRVVAGEFGGRILVSPGGRNVRPTTDRVREALFNILASRVSLDSAAVCDLFAGSGALGIEALSRGAAHVTFVEQARASLDVLRRNIDMLGIGGRSTVVAGTVERFLRSPAGRFDLVFADPPYAYGRYEELVETAAASLLLSGSGLLVVEHASGLRLQDTEHARIVDSRTYGATAITLCTNAAMEDA